MHTRQSFRARFAFAVLMSACLLTVGLMVGGARAATVLALDLAALVQQSDYVVVANAQNEASRYRADRLIVTDVQLRVIESLKGDAKAGALLVATRLGGTVDTIGLTVPGEASFPMGKSAIIFLRRANANELHVVGMSQGVMPIDGAGQGARVLPGGAGATLMQRADDGHLTSVPAALTNAQPLRDVLARITKLVSEAHAP